MREKIESRPAFEKLPTHCIVVAPDNGPEREARIGSALKQEPDERRVFAARDGEPEGRRAEVLLVLFPQRRKLEVGAAVEQSPDSLDAGCLAER